MPGSVNGNAVSAVLAVAKASGIAVLATLLAGCGQAPNPERELAMLDTLVASGCVIDRILDGNVAPHCTGALIADDLVLTAAHCLMISAAEVRCPLSGWAQAVPVAEGRLTEDFSGLDDLFSSGVDLDAGRDVALLRLAQPISAPTLLEVEDEADVDGRFATLARNSEDGVPEESVHFLGPFALQPPPHEHWLGASGVVLHPGDSGGALVSLRSGKAVGVNSTFAADQESRYARLDSATLWLKQAVSDLESRRSVPGPDHRRGFLFDDCTRIESESVCLATTGCGWCLDACLAGAPDGPRVPLRERVLADVCPSGGWSFGM